jgi:hypothetical protein
MQVLLAAPGWAWLTIVMLLLVPGCVMLPVPWRAEKPRFNDEQLAAIVPGTSTRESIASSLGQPSEAQDFVRDEGRYWVYLWTKKGGGRWVAVGYGGAAETPLSNRQFGLFLRFDEGGVLASSSLVEQAWSDERNARICSTEGVCIAHPVNFAEAPFKGEAESPIFYDSGSSFTVPRRSSPVEAPEGHCRVVLWPDKTDWTTPGGISIDYGPARERTSWLPGDAYVVLTESPGERVVRLRNPWFYLNHTRLKRKTQDVPFTCEAGRVYYVVLGAASKNTLRNFGVIWREIPANQARDLLDGMRELLLRDD